MIQEKRIQKRWQRLRFKARLTNLLPQRTWQQIAKWLQSCIHQVYTGIANSCTKFRVRFTSVVAMGYTTEHNYWVSSTAPAETLWQTVNNLADLDDWHPLITGTNAPRGQDAKPGLIYRAFSRYLPVSTQVFVERVLPGELLSVRVFPLPGIQERATYRIVSTLCGTCVLYSISLSGWLTPLVWPVVKPQITQVATSLVEAAEQATLSPSGPTSKSGKERYRLHPKNDIFL